MARRRALVIGGGVGGLSAAIALDRVGFDVAVFEQAEALRDVGAGLVIWCNGIKALRILGVEAAVREQASEFVRFAVRRKDGLLLADSGIHGYGAKYDADPVCVGRPEIIAALAGGSAPGTIRLGARCVGFADDPDGVTARFDDGREERGDLLVGADGLHSVCRGQVRPDRPRYAGYACWTSVVEFEHRLAEPDVVYEFWGPGMRFGLYPGGPGRVLWWAMRKMPAGSPDGPDGRRAELLSAMDDWVAPIPDVIAATQEARILRLDIHDRRPIRRWGRGRVTLLGDAAHPTTPNFGQGATQAIEDAVVLARSLADAPDPVAALRLYERQRAPRTARVIRRSRFLGWIGSWESRAAIALRSRLAGTRLFHRVMIGWLEDLIGYDPPALP